MSANSPIEWCHHTFNPWWGCQRVSPGCEHCYAETMAKRFGHQVWGPAKTTPRRVFGLAHWREPMEWERDAAAAGERRRVFCASMADVFEDNPHPAIIANRLNLWDLIRDTPHLDWLLLTKRPENFAKFLPWRTNPWPNVWLGTSVEDQQRADERIPLLLQTPAAVRFLSCEPLLGPVDLSEWLDNISNLPPMLGTEWLQPPTTPTGWYQIGEFEEPLHWVIAGGESGHGARPMHPDWARSLRDQCQAAGVAFHFKQWGEFGPVAEPHVLTIAGDDVVGMSRLGKHKAGRELDGRTWDEFPESAKELTHV